MKLLTRDLLHLRVEYEKFCMKCSFLLPVKFCSLVGICVFVDIFYCDET